MSISYGISWIYEEFQAARLNNGKCVERWSSAEPVNNLEDFEKALTTAVEILEMHKGGDIAVAYESDEHVHLFLDIPPMSVRDLEKYLERRVEQEKTFKEKAAWAYRATRHGDKGEGVLLHIMPAAIRDTIMRLCDRHGLVPRHLVALTDVMAQHFEDISDKRSKNVLLVALFESRVEMVVVTGEGEALLVRELGFHWKDGNMERLRKDLERTLLYAKQRFGGSGSSVRIMGVDAIVAADKLQPHFSISLEADKDSIDPLFWASEVSSLARKTKSNFIPLMMQRSITGRQLLRLGSRMTVTATVVAVTVLVLVELLIVKYGRLDPDIAQKTLELEQRKAKWKHEFSKLSESQRRLDHLAGETASLPTWFFSSLGSLTSDEVLLNGVALEKHGSQWRFMLKGEVNASLADAATSLKDLELALSDEPWNAAVSNEWEQIWVEQLTKGRATENGLIGFQLEGHIRDE